MEYQYPLNDNWNTEEIIAVVKFFEMIESAYENGVNREQLMVAYRRFKEIVPSKAEEKTLCNEFEKMSGYSTYRTIKKAKEISSTDKIKM